MASDEKDPLHHTKKIEKQLGDLSAHLHADIAKVNEPEMKAMFETAAEVLDGLVRAFQHYEDNKQGAWRKAG